MRRAGGGVCVRARAGVRARVPFSLLELPAGVFDRIHKQVCFRCLGDHLILGCCQLTGCRLPLAVGSQSPGEQQR